MTILVFFNAPNLKEVKIKYGMILIDTPRSSMEVKIILHIMHGMVNVLGLLHFSNNFLWMKVETLSFSIILLWPYNFLLVVQSFLRNLTYLGISLNHIKKRNVDFHFAKHFKNVLFLLLFLFFLLVFSKFI